MKVVFPFNQTLNFSSSNIEDWLQRTDKLTGEEHIGKYSHLIKNRRIFYVLQFNGLSNTNKEQQYKIGVSMSPLGRFKMYFNQAGVNGVGKQGVIVKMILATSRTGTDRNIEYKNHQVVRLEDAIKTTMKEHNKVIRGQEWLLVSKAFLLKTIKEHLTRVKKEGRIYNVKDFNLRNKYTNNIVRKTRSSNIYEVESILDHRVDEYGNNKEYLVKWKDYPISQSTWETENNLKGAKSILNEYKIGDTVVKQK
jgi:hypothetical protein